MSIFGTDCSGGCETCRIHYHGGCAAGHGDDGYVHASEEWIKQFKINESKKDKNIYIGRIIDDTHKVICFHVNDLNNNQRDTVYNRLYIIIKKYEEKKKEAIMREDYVKYMRYIFEMAPIKKYDMVYIDGECLGC